MDRSHIEPISQKNREAVNSFLMENWFSTDMVVRGEVIDCRALDGFVLIEDGAVTGLITYAFMDGVMEIVSLDSIYENRGAGTCLIEMAEEVAAQRGIKAMRLITTNDNLRALGFYQKKGFRLTRLFPGAMDEVRRLKPGVPEIGMDGIPLNDEIELTKNL